MSRLAFSSSRSATTWIVSSRLSRPWRVLALTSTNSISPPHSAGCRPRCGHLGAHALGLRALLVDLVDRDDDRHVGGARVVDRLLGLRLDAVVGRDDDHREIGDPRAAGAHRGEGLVAGRVQEGDDLAGVVRLVGADVLGDAAGLARRDLGLADRVQQRGLAVVDVAHDRHDRRAGRPGRPRRPRRSARRRRRRRRGRSRSPCRTRPRAPGSRRRRASA